MKPMGMFLIFALAVSMISCGENGDPDTEVTVDGTDVPMLHMAFTDSIGVELGDSNYVFGSIEAVSHTQEGNILVLDRARCCVREYSPDGEFLSSLGRKGSGPGEFINPLSMTRLTDGRIIVLDMQTGGIHSFSPDGQWLGITSQITNEPILWMTPAAGSSFIGTLNDWDVLDGQLTVTAIAARFSADSEEPEHIYWEHSFPFDFTDYTRLVEESYFAMTWASDRQDTVFMAARDPEGYLITGYDEAGESFIEISLDLPTVEKSEEELAIESAFWNERARNMGANLEVDFEPSRLRWQIHSMGIDSEKHLWVRRGTEETPTFDVFSFDGELLFSATMPDITGTGGLLWEFRVDESGILAWSLDPEDGYQKLYTVELLE